MSINWRRPHNHNNVFSYLFTANNAEKFKIDVLDTAEKKEQALNFIMRELRDDPIISALDFDRASEESLREWIEVYLDQNVALGCFSDPKGTLVAVDNLYVRNIRDTFPELTKNSGDAFTSFIQYTKAIGTRVWYLSNAKVCNYLTSSGVFVSPAYRNIGIINRMIRMRIRVAESLGIELIGSAFIGNEMHAAKNCKYRFLESFRHPKMRTDLAIQIWVFQRKNKKEE